MRVFNVYQTLKASEVCLTSREYSESVSSQILGTLIQVFSGLVEFLEFAFLAILKLECFLSLIFWNLSHSP